MDRDNRVATTTFIRRGIGGICLGIGLIGLLLPLIPGIPFLIVGGLLLRPRRLRRDEPRERRGKTGKRVGQLDVAQQLQLAFWKLCRSITTRLDARTRTIARAQSK